MFEEFDEYISGFAMEDFSFDYWYDQGADIAENMLCRFEENDWEKLLKEAPIRTIEWQKRLAYCLHDGNNLNQLKALLSLIQTDDAGLLEVVVDSLRDFTSEKGVSLMQMDPDDVSRIGERISGLGGIAQRIFEEFRKQVECFKVVKNTGIVL